MDDDYVLKRVEEGLIKLTMWTYNYRMVLYFSQVFLVDLKSTL